MSSILPDASRFETPVYGTIFASRAEAVRRLTEGEVLILVPDPAVPSDAAALDADPAAAHVPLVAEQPKVWVHAPGGDVLGHLSPDINRWLVPRMLSGVRYSAAVQSLGRPDQESWRRLVILVRESASGAATS